MPIKKNQVSPIPIHETIVDSNGRPTQALVRYLQDVRSSADNRDLIKTIDNILIGVGLDEDGNYIIPEDTNFLDMSTSIYNALLILDNSTSTTLIISTDISLVLSAQSQSVLVDATSGEISVTLPNPNEYIEDNRSYRTGITKVDTTRNKVNILPFGSELIVGETSQSLRREGEVLNFITDGTNWWLEN